MIIKRGPGVGSSADTSLAAGLQINLDRRGAGDKTLPFIRRDKQSNALMLVNGVEYSAPASFDNGWIDSNFELIDPMPAHTTRYRVVICLGPENLTGFAPETLIPMKVTWTGGAPVTGLSGLSISSLSVNLGSRFATFLLNDIANAWVDFAFADSGSTTADPPLNVKIFQVAHETVLNAGAIFDPDWLTEVSRFAVLRTMDWQATNLSQAVAYTDLPTESSHFWMPASDDMPGNVITSGQKVGMPATLLAKLATQSGKPVWVCIPHKFTDAAVASFATVLRDNTSVPIYYEYSNEVWNSGFHDSGGLSGQYTYANAQAVTLFGGNGIEWYGYRSAQIMDVVRGVYGSDSGAGRWTGVLSVQSASTGQFTDAFVGVDYYIANEAVNHSMPKNKLFTYGAIAPYIGGYAGHSYMAFTPTDVDAGTDTFSIAASDPNHLFIPNQPVTLTTSGTLPAGLFVSTPYFVKVTGDTTFQLSLTSGGAAVNFTTTGSGTSYVRTDHGATLSDWADVSQSYFNQQLYDMLKPSVAASTDPYFNLAQNRSDALAHKALLVAAGMNLVWYEGGNTMATALPLRDSNCGEVMGTKVTLALANFADSQQAADLHDAQIIQFLADGGIMASKYLDTRSHNRFGPWGAKRWFSDTTNPVWVALTRQR